MTPNNDSQAHGAPSPLWRPSGETPADGAVPNPASAAPTPPPRVVPEGFSRTFDEGYAATYGPLPTAGAPATAAPDAASGADGGASSESTAASARWAAPNEASNQSQPLQPPSTGQQYAQQYAAPQYVQPQYGQPPYGQPQGYGQTPALRPWQRPPGVPAALPLEGQVYAQTLRPLTKRVGRWFLAWLIGIGIFGAGQVITMILILPPMFAVFTDPSLDPNDPSVAIDAVMEILGTPIGFLAVNLSWAVMIPGAVVALAAYGDKVMGYAFSVAGKWRWRVTARAAMVVVPIFAIYITGSFLIDPTIEYRWQPDWVLIAIVLLTTPLQSSGEEFAFRGFVTQQLGGWISNKWVASLLTGVLIGALFGVLHIGYPPLAILQVGLVGFTASMLTFRTGGLEAACVLHSANNVFIMLPLAFMGMSPFATSDGGEQDLILQLAGFGMALAALGLSYVAVHFTMRDVQRTTLGAPGAERLVRPTIGAAPGMPSAFASAGNVPPAGQRQQYAPVGEARR